MTYTLKLTVNKAAAAYSEIQSVGLVEAIHSAQALLDRSVGTGSGKIEVYEGSRKDFDEARCASVAVLTAPP